MVNMGNNNFEIKKLGDVTNITMGQSPESKYYNKKNIGLPLIQGNADIKNRETIVRTFTSKYPKRGKMGDTIMSVRAPVGEIAKATFDCCLGRGVCAISYVNNYIYYYLMFVEKKWASQSTGSTFDSINSKEVNNLEILLPKSKEEQNTIVKILSDAHELIKQLDYLITKKKNIKQGTIQELLTGKRRLSGFNKKWDFDEIQNHANITTGSKNTDDRIKEGKFPFFVRSKKIERINTYSFDGEAVLTAGDGDIGKIFHYINGKFDFHQRVYKISNFDDFLVGYFFYIYFKEHFLKRVMSMTAKSTVDSIRMEMISKMLIPLPEKKEQLEIGEVLFDLDLEIKELETKKDKYIMIKEGMMQKLLTGEIRLE